jgi:hypothetical protein
MKYVCILELKPSWFEISSLAIEFMYLKMSAYGRSSADLIFLHQHLK